MELGSVWWLYVLAGALVLVEFGESQLLECAKCDDREPNQCGSDPDFCAGHDRCFRMKYKGPNGRMVEKAGCGHETKCGRKAGKMQMCQKKDKCEITMCCKDNLCNSPAILISSQKQNIKIQKPLEKKNVTMCCKDNLCNSPAILISSQKYIIVVASLTSIGLMLLFQ